MTTSIILNRELLPPITQIIQSMFDIEEHYYLGFTLTIHPNVFDWAAGQCRLDILHDRKESSNSLLNLNSALCCAAAANQLPAMRLLKEWGAYDFNWALCWAAEANHLSAMHLLKEWKADDFNLALIRAAQANQLLAMCLLKEWGADDFDAALRWAARASQAMRLLKEWGAS